MPEVNKWTKDFLIALFYSVYTTQGRLNVSNLSRYSPYTENTFYRNYAKAFDFRTFNAISIDQVNHEYREWIAVADCSFVNKNGKHTYGLDKFWSGVEGREKQGLEISAVSLIDVATNEAYALDVDQTPAKLSNQEGDQSKYTRIDFYAEQFASCVDQLRAKGVRYGVFDGYYTKKKMLDMFDRYEDLEMIGKLRSDARLRYLYDEAERGPALTKRIYDGKVCYDDSTNG